MGGGVMSLAVIDAREWQNRFDLETGQPLKSDAPVAEMAAGVISRHPYPGDVDEQANQWVTDTALDFIAHYEPDLVCLSYVQQFFLTGISFTRKRNENACLPPPWQRRTGLWTRADLHP
jgi:hypothetical protein